MAAPPPQVARLVADVCHARAGTGLLFNTNVSATNNNAALTGSWTPPASVNGSTCSSQGFTPAYYSCQVSQLLSPTGLPDVTVTINSAVPVLFSLPPSLRNPPPPPPAPRMPTQPPPAPHYPPKCARAARPTPTRAAEEPAHSRDAIRLTAASPRSFVFPPPSSPSPPPPPPSPALVQLGTRTSYFSSPPPPPTPSVRSFNTAVDSWGALNTALSNSNLPTNYVYTITITADISFRLSPQIVWNAACTGSCVVQLVGNSTACALSRQGLPPTLSNPGAPPPRPSHARIFAHLEPSRPAAQASHRGSSCARWTDVLRTRCCSSRARALATSQ